MAARARTPLEGRLKKSFLPIFIAALLVVPNNPFVAAAAAQVLGAAADGAVAPPAGGASAAAGANASAATPPAPIGLTLQNFAAPLGMGAPTAAQMAPAALTPAAARPAPQAAPAIAAAPTAAAELPTAAAAAALNHNAFRPALDRAEIRTSADADGAVRFDGSSSKNALDESNLTVILMRPGAKAVTTTLAQLHKSLSSGEYSKLFNKNGHLRVVLADGKLGGPTISETDVPSIVAAVRAAGLEAADKRTRNEAIHVTLPGSAAAPAQADGAAPQAVPKVSTSHYVIRAAVGAATIGTYLAIFGATNILGMVMLAGIASNLDRLVKETIYSVTMLKAAMRESKHPGWTEVVGGLLSKVIPAFINIGVFATMYRGHHAALIASVALSLLVETFHGVWVNAWDTFQSKIGRHRGPLFQNIFNFFYGQLISGSYRLIAFFALAMAPPWSVAYWKPMIVMTVIGTFCGTLGYRGLNSMYEKGRVPRKGRAGIQQARDLLMMLVGPFFSTGNMFLTWLIFFSQQSIDLVIYGIDRRLQTRPIVYVADTKVAQSEDFHKIYLAEKSSAVNDALEGVKGFILVKPFVALYRWAKARRKPEAAP
ncbi:MAG: hypothetical protein ACHQ49_04860 [Elusimicrobiota bacterium]